MFLYISNTLSARIAIDTHMENEFTQPSDHLAQSVGSIKHFVSLDFYQICFSLYVSKFLIQNNNIHHTLRFNIF